MSRTDDDRFHVATFPHSVIAARFPIDLQNYLAQPGTLVIWESDDEALEVLGPPPGAMVGPNARNELYLTEKALKAANAACLSVSIARVITRRDLPPNSSVLVTF